MVQSLTQSDLTAIETTTQRLGRELFDRLEARRPGVFEGRWWDEQVLATAMQDEAVKVQMFRFVDVLPMLQSDAAVAETLIEYFDEVRDRVPRPVRLGLDMAAASSLFGKTLGRATRMGAARQARRFIAGTNVQEVLDMAQHHRRLKRAFTLDILGEAVTSDAEAEVYFDAYLRLIRTLAPIVNAWPEIAIIDRDDRGHLARTNLSIKLSALDCGFDEIDPSRTHQRVAPRLRQLLRAALEHRAFINLDMESYHTKDLTLHIFKSVLEEPEFRDMGDVGIVIQCYLRDSERDLGELADWAARRGTPIWVRLVKGAYWDYETVHARAQGWPVPVYERKWDTDANFERQCRFTLQHSDWLRPAIASHNVRSVAHALAAAHHLSLPRERLELQMLYGMADSEKHAVVDMGYRMRVYMPYGELIPGMAYLVRRLLENTSNDSFLRAAFAQGIPQEKLLMNPLDHPPEAKQPDASVVAQVGAEPFWAQFANQAPLDFANADNRSAMAVALDAVGEALGRSYPLVLGGDRVTTDGQIVSHDPSQKDRNVGTVAAASVDAVQTAVAYAKQSQPQWSACGALQRADYLRRTAEVMRRRRYELAAWEIYECGKGWREADADVCEAIDFCEYYAAGAQELERPYGLDAPGEENRIDYIPLGVAAIIAPWNFPLAILTGMTTAALAVGNTVVMKPAEQSPVVAAKLMEIFGEVGLPAGVANYSPGEGQVAGAALVDHPDVAVIAFTGSREVGLAIHARAAEVSRNRPTGIKRVIAEMGGKNAVIVDTTADLDEAVLGVVYSAFGYQGQKCSACSRAIVMRGVYDRFLERLVEATRSLQIGPATDPSTDVGPLIDEGAWNKVHQYIEIGRQEAREALSLDVGSLSEAGYFVGPHIFADVSPTARLAQEEIFGPVLAVMGAEDLDDAIRIANGTPFALTAGIFSRSPANLERARQGLQVGNLYLNRGCTGALVGRQPFGGYKMSGMGSKAGGPDYLRQFVVPRTITENTMRRGFAPGDG